MYLLINCSVYSEPVTSHALGGLEGSRLNNSNNNKKSSDVGSVPDPKILEIRPLQFLQKGNGSRPIASPFLYITESKA